MIHIAIVEDEKEFAQTLQEYIQRYMAETHTAIQADTFHDGMSFLDEYSGKYQIVFMDIAMPHMNGMDTAERLRKVDSNVCLIFITSLAQYAIRGYEVEALDFIVKPVAYDLFKIRLEKAISRIRTADYYTIKTANGLRKIRLSDLIYIESNKHYLYFHTTTETSRMRGTMRDLEGAFEQKGFALISGSLLVNLSYVEEIEGNSVTAGGEMLAVARAYKTKFRERLTEYMGGMI